MLDATEAQSMEENKWVQHPKISFVYVFGKNYRCNVHPNLNLNKGSMHQHMRGRLHRLDFETGLPINHDEIKPKYFEPIESEIKESKDDHDQSISDKEDYDPVEDAICEYDRKTEENFAKLIKKWTKIKEMEWAGMPQNRINYWKKRLGFEDTETEYFQFSLSDQRRINYVMSQQRISDMFYGIYLMFEGKKRDALMDELYKQCNLIDYLKASINSCGN